MATKPPRDPTDKRPAPLTNGVNLPVKPRGIPPKAAGNRLPSPRRPPLSTRLVARPLLVLPAATPPPLSELDEPTLVDDATKVMTPPPPPAVVAATPRWKLPPEPTQIVIPLPPPPDAPSTWPRKGSPPLA